MASYSKPVSQITYTNPSGPFDTGLSSRSEEPRRLSETKVYTKPTFAGGASGFSKEQSAFSSFQQQQTEQEKLKIVDQYKAYKLSNINYLKDKIANLKERRAIEKEKISKITDSEKRQDRYDDLYLNYDIAIRESQDLIKQISRDIEKIDYNYLVNTGPGVYFENTGDVDKELNVHVRNEIRDYRDRQDAREEEAQAAGPMKFVTYIDVNGKEKMVTEGSYQQALAAGKVGTVKQVQSWNESNKSGTGYGVSLPFSNITLPQSQNQAVVKATEASLLEQGITPELLQSGYISSLQGAYASTGGFSGAGYSSDYYDKLNAYKSGDKSAPEYKNYISSKLDNINAIGYKYDRDPATNLVTMFTEQKVARGELTAEEGAQRLFEVKSQMVGLFGEQNKGDEIYKMTFTYSPLSSSEYKEYNKIASASGNLNRQLNAEVIQISPEGYISFNTQANKNMLDLASKMGITQSSIDKANAKLKLYLESKDNAKNATDFFINNKVTLDKDIGYTVNGTPIGTILGTDKQILDFTILKDYVLPGVNYITTQVYDPISNSYSNVMSTTLKEDSGWNQSKFDSGDYYGAVKDMKSGQLSFGQSLYNVESQKVGAFKEMVNVPASDAERQEKIKEIDQQVINYENILNQRSQAVDLSKVHSNVAAYTIFEINKPVEQKKDDKGISFNIAGMKIDYEPKPVVEKIARTYLKNGKVVTEMVDPSIPFVSDTKQITNTTTGMLESSMESIGALFSNSEVGKQSAAMYKSGTDIINNAFEQILPTDPKYKLAGKEQVNILSMLKPDIPSVLVSDLKQPIITVGNIDKVYNLEPASSSRELIDRMSFTKIEESGYYTPTFKTDLNTGKWVAGKSERVVTETVYESKYNQKESVSLNVISPVKEQPKIEEGPLKETWTSNAYGGFKESLYEFNSGLIKRYIPKEFGLQEYALKDLHDNANKEVVFTSSLLSEYGLPSKIIVSDKSIMQSIDYVEQSARYSTKKNTDKMGVLTSEWFNVVSYTPLDLYADALKLKIDINPLTTKEVKVSQKKVLSDSLYTTKYGLNIIGQQLGGVTKSVGELGANSPFLSTNVMRVGFKTADSILFVSKNKPLEQVALTFTAAAPFVMLTENPPIEGALALQFVRSQLPFTPEEARMGAYDSIKELSQKSIIVDAIEPAFALAAVFTSGAAPVVGQLIKQQIKSPITGAIKTVLVSSSTTPTIKSQLLGVATLSSIPVISGVMQLGEQDDRDLIERFAYGAGRGIGTMYFYNRLGKVKDVVRYETLPEINFKTGPRTWDSSVQNWVSKIDDQAGPDIFLSKTMYVNLGEGSGIIPLASYGEKFGFKFGGIPTKNIGGNWRPRIADEAARNLANIQLASKYNWIDTIQTAKSQKVFDIYSDTLQKNLPKNFVEPNANIVMIGKTKIQFTKQEVDFILHIDDMLRNGKYEDLPRINNWMKGQLKGVPDKTRDILVEQLYNERTGILQVYGSFGMQSQTLKSMSNISPELKNLIKEYNALSITKTNRPSGDIESLLSKDYAGSFSQGVAAKQIKSFKSPLVEKQPLINNFSQPKLTVGGQKLLLTLDKSYSKQGDRKSVG
jgi:ribosomal protein L30E